MRKGLSLVCLGAVLWGTAGLAAKVLIVRFGMEPLTIGAWRLATAAPLLLAAAFWEGRRVCPPSVFGREARWWVLLFGLAVAGYQAGYFTAVDRTMVSTATLLTVCTAPLMVAAFSGVFLGERPGEGTVTALALGLTGAVLLIGVEGAAGLADPRHVTGNVLALFAAVCYGGYTLIGKRLLAILPPFRVVGTAFLLGAMFLLPVFRLPPPSLEAWVLLLYLGAVPTALAYLLYMAGLARTAATRASIGALLEPMTAALLAVLLLGERLTAAGWAGSGLLLASLVLLALPRRNRRQRAAREQKGAE